MELENQLIIADKSGFLFDKDIFTLGPVGMVRFPGQFEMGSGDYTRDREEWLKGLITA